jgi:HEAT repeat protein
MSIASQKQADAETADLELLALAESNPHGLISRLISRLCDDSSLDLDALTSLFKHAARFQPTLDVDLARTLVDNRELLADERLVLRVLQIIEGAGKSQRIMPILVRMQNCESLRVRSKVAMMLNRNKSSSSWLAERLRHPDSQVRASSLETVLLTDHEAMRDVLRSALCDPADRVVGNALLALYRLGDEDAITKLVAMGSHGSPEFRATAAWVMGETGDSVFRRTLMEMRTREKDNVWLHVMRALTRINRIQANALVRELTGAA